VATQTLTFLFADIEGSTEMAQRLGGGRAGRLAGHHRLIRASLAWHAGEEVVTRGDGVVTVFASLRACADVAVAHGG
jgi:class 3 adenylate cyclase